MYSWMTIDYLIWLWSFSIKIFFIPLTKLESDSFWWGKRPQSFLCWYIGDQPLTSPFSFLTSQQAVPIKPTNREIRGCH